MHHDSQYTYLTGDRYVQVASVTKNLSGEFVNVSSPFVTLLGIGYKFREGFLKDSSIANNIQVLETLIQYDNVPNAIINIKPSFWNKNVWKTTVYIAGMKVFSSDIRFSDDMWYEVKLLKLKYGIK